MSTWTPEAWTAFFTALGGFIAALAAATVAIINALKQVRTKLTDHEVRSEKRTRELSQQIEETRS